MIDYSKEEPITRISLKEMMERLRENNRILQEQMENIKSSQEEKEEEFKSFMREIPKFQK